MAERVVLDAGDLTGLAVAAFTAAGVAPEDAAVTAWALVEADLMGIETHGVIRVPAYVERIRLGGIDPTARVSVDCPAASLALVDGADGLGPVVGSHGLETAMDMARETGIAYVGCRRSNHFGALAPYAFKACEAGFVMLGGTNASVGIPPWGGREPRMGNNPFCMAAPVPGKTHFILDMAMSVAARGKIRAAHKKGEPIPQGWATDALGRPTTDAGEALKGFLAPMGGYKGSGMSQAVDILSGVLSGAGFLTGINSWIHEPEKPSGLGHFFLLIDPGRLLGREVFGEAMTRFCDDILSTPPSDPAEPVRLPGQKEQEARLYAMNAGIAVPRDVLDSLQALAA